MKYQRYRDKRSLLSLSSQVVFDAAKKLITEEIE